MRGCELEARVLNPAFEAFDVIDKFESFIWTDRFFGYGDFELLTDANSKNLSALVSDNILVFDKSEHAMIVETHEIKTNAEAGTSLLTKGRSLESILERRIVWVQTVLDGNFQAEIKRLINENAISPTDANRKISNLIFEDSTDARITAMTVSAQFTGDNLYTAISDMCFRQNVGFKITLNSQGKLVFKLYMGQDRSYEQIANSFVVFSPDFENLLNSDYSDSTVPYKNTALVGGEGEGAARRFLSLDMAATELARRELFVNASDISSSVEGGTLTEVEYNALLSQRGEENLSQNTSLVVFEGEAELTQKFVYSTDFFMGDVVQIANEYGMTGRSKVTEIIFSQDPAGEKAIPKFLTV